MALRAVGPDRPRCPCRPSRDPPLSTHPSASHLPAMATAMRRRGRGQ